MAEAPCEAPAACMDKAWRGSPQRSTGKLPVSSPACVMPARRTTLAPPETAPRDSWPCAPRRIAEVSPWTLLSPRAILIVAHRPTPALSRRRRGPDDAGRSKETTDDRDSPDRERQPGQGRWIERVQSEAARRPGGNRRAGKKPDRRAKRQHPRQRSRHPWHEAEPPIGPD